MNPVTPSASKPAARSRGPRDDRGAALTQITAAARTSFAQNGWAGTTMRGVARAASVDPALVHYYFKSKEALLDASTNPPAELIAKLKDIESVRLEHRGNAILERVLWVWTRPETREVLRSILLTAAHEERTRNKLQLFFAATILPSVAPQWDDDQRTLRAGLVASQVAGLIMTRWIWEIDPLASLPDEELIALIGPTLQRYLSAPLS